MRFFRIFGILFYAGSISLIGAGLIVLAVMFSLRPGVIQPADVSNFMAYFQDTFSARLILGLSGGLIILVSFSLAQYILGGFQSEKTIAFPTASGEVTVTLTAVEDLIKKLAVLVPEIKELRPDVIAQKKKGIIVDLRVVLKSEANIPELSARLQDIVKAKIQEVLGLEEQIAVKIHFVKIITFEEKDRKHHKEPVKEDPIVPYSGYRRV